MYTYTDKHTHSKCNIYQIYQINTKGTINFLFGKLFVVKK